MTSLLPAPDRTELRHRRPLLLLAPVAGASAAGATLIVCLGAAVIGWFLGDAGTHGTPRGGLRVGALAWLMGHGSGLSLDEVAIDVVPLGITLACAWTIWRLGLRLGDSISGHGPDADALADGARDWTVPSAAGLFAAGYLAVALVTLRLAASDQASAGGRSLVLWILVLCAAVALPAIAVGSGRAAIWASTLPPLLWGAIGTARLILRTWLLVCAALFVLALLLDLNTAVNVMSQLHTDAGATTSFVVLCLLLVPNAVVFAGSWLLGPGFTVGVGTIVSPGAVAIGPLPMFPLFAALPDNGSPAAWVSYVVGVPFVIALVAAVRAHRAMPTTRWDEALVRGLAGGVLAAVAFGVLAAVAGGAVGPGRMSDVSPLVLQSTLHAVVAFGLGGLLGALASHFWEQRR